MAEKTIEINLGRAVRLDELPSLGAAVLRWWGAELLDAMPARLREALPRRKAEAHIIASASSWHIRRRQDEQVREVEIDASLSDAELRKEVIRTFPDNAQSRVVVLIPGEQALIRRLQLPMMTDARVRPAVELQIDRLTPFTGENVRFACRVVERRIEENDMTAEIAVVPRQTLAAIESRLAAAGITPTLIDVAGHDGVGLGFNLRDEGHSALHQRYRLINMGLAVGAALAWLMAYYAFGVAGEAEIARWQARVAELRPTAQRSADMARQIEALSQPTDIAATRGDVSALDVLRELTTIMPDSAHLFELRFNGSNIEATGLAVDAPNLIAKLDASKLFADARFRAPVTRREGTARDRFELTLKLEKTRR